MDFDHRGLGILVDSYPMALGIPNISIRYCAHGDQTDPLLEAPLSPTKLPTEIPQFDRELQGSILTKTALLVKRDQLLFDLRTFTCTEGVWASKWIPTCIDGVRAHYVCSYCPCCGGKGDRGK